jgi:hypothetical protein
VLRYIRDGEANSLEELCDVTGLNNILSLSARTIGEGLLTHILRDLEEASLIAVDNGKFRPAPLLDKIQKALRLRLTELSRWGGSAVPVLPLFGRPQEPRQACDVFVVMPFRKELQAVYAGPIQRVIQRLNLTVARGDDFFSTGSVMEQIWSAIYHCGVVVADCTDRNANVFYEIGIAHTVGRPVVLLAQGIEDVPFDVRHLRTILYATTEDGLAELEDSLASALQDLQGRNYT